jgi:hypothetical protein
MRSRYSVLDALYDVHRRASPGGWTVHSLEHARAEGVVIEVLFDHDAGTLNYRLNDGQVGQALGGFPKGAALRLWAALDDRRRNHRMTIVRPWIDRGE